MLWWSSSLFWISKLFFGLQRNYIMFLGDNWFGRQGIVVRVVVQLLGQDRFVEGEGFFLFLFFCTLMLLGLYLSMRFCIWLGRVGGNSKELRRGFRCFWLMNLVRCFLVMQGLVLVWLQVRERSIGLYFLGWGWGLNNFFFQ